VHPDGESRKRQETPQGSKARVGSVPSSRTTSLLVIILQPLGKERLLNPTPLSKTNPSLQWDQNVPVEKVVDSLKPRGIVVMECGPGFLNGRNAMLHLFDPLEIVHYEIVRDKADFYDRRETDVIRLVARKP
jgi:hypothetical protein